MRQFIFAVLAAGLLLAGPAVAQNTTWTGLVGDGQWFTSNNWNNGVPGTGTPSANGTAVFQNIFAPSGVTLFGPSSALDGILFTNSPSAYTLNGGTLNLVNNGFIRINEATATANQAFNSPVAFNGSGTLQNDSTAGAVLTFRNVSTTAGGLLTVNATGAVNISGVISGGSLTKTGTGTLELTGTNTYTGGTTINGGTISTSVLADGGSNSGIGASTSAATNLVLSGGGTLLYTSGTTSTNRAFTVGSGGGTINVSTVSTTLTVSGAGTGIGRLTKAGNGTLILTASQGYSGGTSVTGGILQIGNGGSTGSLNVTGNIALSSGTTLVHNRTGTDVFDGTITGSGGALTKSGGGTLLLTGNTNYTGNTTITGNSTLQIGAGGSGGTLGGTNVDIGAGSTLRFNKATNSTYTNSLTGSGAFINFGGGTLNLLGNSSAYTGNVSASAGILRVDSTATLGSNGSQTVTVNAGATLSGEGTIGGVVTYNNGSNLDIGNGSAADIGTLTFSNRLNLNAGAIAAFNFNRSLGSTTAGVGYDTINVNGGANSITLGGAISLSVNNSGGTSFPDLPLVLINGSPGSLTAGTAFSNFTQGQEVTAMAGFGGVSNWFMTYDYANGDVLIVPIPEPVSVLGLAAAGLGLARWLRRNNHRLVTGSGEWNSELGVVLNASQHH